MRFRTIKNLWLKRKGSITSLVIMAMRAVTLGSKLGLAIFIGRYLDLASLGLYGLGSAAVTLGPVLIGLGMIHTITRDAVTLPLAEMISSLRHYWSFVAAAYSALLVAAIAVSALLDATWLWVLVLAVVLFEHLGNDVFVLLSTLERPFLANANSFVRNSGWVLIYVPAAIWEPGLRSLSAVFAFWLAGAVAGFLQFIWAARTWPWTAAFARPFRRPWITATIKGAVMVYISDLSYIASYHLDRYIVTAFLGIQLAGVYFLYWSAANAVSTMVSVGVFQVQRPRLIKAHAQDGNSAHRLLVAVVAKTTILASVALSGLVGGAFYLALPLLKQPVVADYLWALALIMVGAAMRNLAELGALALFTARRDRTMTLTCAAAAVALLAAQIMLLPIAGLYGAGMAILIAFAATALWQHFLLVGHPRSES